MKSRMAWVGVACLILAPAALGATADDTQKDRDQIRGKWAVSEFIINGKPIPDEDRTKISITFTDEKMTLQGPGGIGVRNYSYKLDPAKSPKAMDMSPLDGDFKGDTVPTIYEVKGDSLKLCMPNKPGSGRPTAFESPEKSGIGLFILRRAKD